MLRLEIGDARWFTFVSESDDATPFHHPDWAALLGDCYRYRPFALALEDDAGRIVAGLPVLDVSNRLRGKRWVSLPYTDVCPPLGASSGRLQELVAGLDEMREQQEIPQFEIRARLPGTTASTRADAVIHALPLSDDPERMERRLKRTVRQHIAKGTRAGVTVGRAEKAEDLTDTFYSLHVSTRRRQGVPVQPRRYFVGLWRHIFEQGLGFCLLAHSRDKPVAGAVFLTWKDTIVYKYSASDDRYRDLQPNYALLWDAIRWGGANGYAALDLGRSDLAHAGLRHFKSSWGALESALEYSFLGSRHGSGFSARGIGLLGPAIRRSPRIVCRTLGQLLYRYAA